MIAEIKKQERQAEVEDLNEKAIKKIKQGKFRDAIDTLVLLLQIKEGIAIADQPSSKKLRDRINGVEE